MANLLAALSRTDPYNEYFVFSAPPELRKTLGGKSFRFLGPATESSSRMGRTLAKQPAFYEQFWIPSMVLRYGLTLLHYTDNSATIAADVPYVVTVHDTMFLRPLRESYPHATARQRLLDLYKKWVVPVAARSALAVLTVSEFSKRGIVNDLKVPEEKVHVTPEGVDLEAFRPAGKDGKRREGPPVVLVHAADDERKNLTNILKAFRHILKKRPDAILAAMGMDERGIRRSGASRLAREWGLTPNLQMLGDVPRKRLRETYLRADVLLLASRWEGFGLPVLEAFACGVPVVASRTTALPEVAGNAAVLADPEDPKALAEAVLKVLDSPALARSLARKGFARAKQFSWDRTARLTLEVYRKAALALEYDKQGKRRIAGKD